MPLGPCQDTFNLSKKKKSMECFFFFLNWAPRQGLWVWESDFLSPKLEFLLCPTLKRLLGWYNVNTKIFKIQGAPRWNTWNMICLRKSDMSLYLGEGWIKISFSRTIWSSWFGKTEMLPNTSILACTKYITASVPGTLRRGDLGGTGLVKKGGLPGHRF